MSNTFEITYERKEYEDFAPENYVRAFAEVICAELNLKNCEFSLGFITEDSMKSFNKQYRNIDGSTDILSFAVEDSDDFDFIVPKNRKRNIGDMLICPEVLKSNAVSFNVSEDNELKRLIIHGLLHLTGNNHLTNNPQEPMLLKQEEILQKTADMIVKA